MLAEWNRKAAAARQAGEPSRALYHRYHRYHRRLATFLALFAQRMNNDGGWELRRKLARTGGSGFREVEKVMRALEVGAIQLDPSPFERIDAGEWH